MATFLTLTAGQVEYATRTKIMELSLEIANSYSLLRVKDNIRRIAKLLRYLRVLHEDASLTYEEEQAIYQVLIKIGELYHIPTAPTVTSTRIVNIIFGTPGTQGPPGPAGAPGTGFPHFADDDVDGFEVIDSVDANDTRGVRWDYYIIGGGVGEGMRGGSVLSIHNTITTEWFEYSTGDLGGITSPVTFSVDLSGGALRLLANVTTPNWIIRGARYQMQDLIV